MSDPFRVLTSVSALFRSRISRPWVVLLVVTKPHLVKAADRSPDRPPTVSEDRPVFFEVYRVAFPKDSTHRRRQKKKTVSEPLSFASLSCLLLVFVLLQVHQPACDHFSFEEIRHVELSGARGARESKRTPRNAARFTGGVPDCWFG